MDFDEPKMPHFLKGGAGGIGKLTDEEEAEAGLRMSKYITEMDEELRDRFKALKALQDICKELDEEEQKEIKLLELEYENKYKDIYAQREALINGKSDINPILIEEFEARVLEMKDEDYEKLVVTPCDVKSIQNISKGVSDFWVKAMLNHPCGGMISEKDRPILGYLQNIELDLHTDDEGYDLIFTFAENNYFNGTVIKKQLFLKDKGICDKSVSTPIEWKEGCNPTIKKQKKKRKGKKVNVEVKCESFFNFFENLDADDDKEKEKKEKKEGDDDESDGDDIQDKLADDLEQSD